MIAALVAVPDAAQSTPPPAAASARPSLTTGLVVVASVAYPLVVWLCLGRVSPRWVALGLEIGRAHV